MSTIPQQRTGGCLCGKVRYTITDKHGPDISQIYCHCINCQRNFGNSLACSFVPQENFAFTEGAKAYVSVYRDQDTTSGDVMQRQFCSKCGSCVLITTDHNKAVAIVPVGSMDCGGKGWFKVQHECFCSNRKEWMPQGPDGEGGSKKWDGMPQLE